MDQVSRFPMFNNTKFKTFISKKFSSSNSFQHFNVFQNQSPHIITPLIFSDKLTKLVGKGPVYLKLDNLQPPGSFKIRGIGRTCLEAKSKGASAIVGSSGGNAGKAMAYASRKLNMKSVLFIPKSTPQMMIDKINVSQFFTNK